MPRMKYEEAPDLQKRMLEIIELLDMNHIDRDRVVCLRSTGTSTKRTIARCHTLNKVMQKAMGVKSFYTIEFLELFERLSYEEQDKVIIHELMHIPKTFGGGFRQHDYVCDKNIDIFHKQYLARKRGQGFAPSGEINNFIDEKPREPKRGVWRWA